MRPSPAGSARGGPLFAGHRRVGLGRNAFLLNARIYVLSFCIYRFGGRPRRAATDGSRRRRRPPSVGWPPTRLLRAVERLVLAPTWIALNAALGLWTTQSIFQLVKKPAPRFADQLLMGRADPIVISVGLVVAGSCFFAGLASGASGSSRMRRTTIIFYGIVGGGACVVAAAVLNHSRGLAGRRARRGSVVLGGLFVLAGATPAALGLLADISEAFPADRGAIMGLY